MQSCGSNPGLPLENRVCRSQVNGEMQALHPGGSQGTLGFRANRFLFAACVQYIFCRLGCDLSSSPTLPWPSAWSPAVLIWRKHTAQQEAIFLVPITALQEKEYQDSCLKSKGSPCRVAKFIPVRASDFYKRNPPPHSNQKLQDINRAHHHQDSLRFQYSENRTKVTWTWPLDRS